MSKNHLSRSDPLINPLINRCEKFKMLWNNLPRCFLQSTITSISVTKNSLLIRKDYNCNGFRANLISNTVMCPGGVHAVTEWVQFNGTQNSIFELSFELNLSKTRFSVKWSMIFLLIVLYFTSYKLGKCRKSAEKLNLSQHYERPTYLWLSLTMFYPLNVNQQLAFTDNVSKLFKL